MKRGQVTIYIIIGIVIVSVIFLSIFLYSKFSETATDIVEEQTLTFKQQVAQVEEKVQRCLEESSEKAVLDLTDKTVIDYEQQLADEIKIRVEQCSNFETYAGLSINPGQITQLDATLSNDKGAVTVEMTRPMKIISGEQEAKLNDFSVEVKLKKSCCMPVEVDSDCRAVEAGEYSACGILLVLEAGQKAQLGGDCVAC